MVSWSEGTSSMLCDLGFGIDKKRSQALGDVQKKSEAIRFFTIYNGVFGEKFLISKRNCATQYSQEGWTQDATLSLTRSQVASSVPTNTDRKEHQQWLDVKTCLSGQ